MTWHVIRVRSKDAQKQLARTSLTIRLWAWDFYKVIVDEAKGRINYCLIEIESE